MPCVGENRALPRLVLIRSFKYDAHAGFCYSYSKMQMMVAGRSMNAFSVALRCVFMGFSRLEQLRELIVDFFHGNTTLYDVEFDIQRCPWTRWLA